MTRRRLTFLGLTLSGIGLLILTGILLADGSRALVSSTVNTGATLAAAALLAAGFFALAPPAPGGRYQRFTPLVCAALFVAVPAVAAALLGAIVPAGAALPTPALAALLGHAGIVGAVFWLTRGTDLRVSEIVGPLPRDTGSWSSLALVVPLVMLSWGELALLLNLSMLVTPGPTAVELADGLLETSTQAILQSPLGLLAIVGTGPAVEELIFRGLLLPHWRERRGGALAVLGSAAVFALIHLNVLSATSTLLMGVVTALVYLRSGSLLLPVLIHGLHNLASALLITIPQLQINSPAQLQSWLWSGVGLTLGAAVWLWLALRKAPATGSSARADLGSLS